MRTATMVTVIWRDHLRLATCCERDGPRRWGLFISWAGDWETLGPNQAAWVEEEATATLVYCRQAHTAGHYSHYWHCTSALGAVLCLALLLLLPLLAPSPLPPSLSSTLRAERAPPSSALCSARHSLIACMSWALRRSLPIPVDINQKRRGPPAATLDSPIDSHRLPRNAR